jgi:hypothetical protein
MTWKLDLLLYFLSQIPLYARCSGASSVYASCKAVREHICGKIYIFGPGLNKKGLISMHREMKKGPLCKIAMVRKILSTLVSFLGYPLAIPRSTPPLGLSRDHLFNFDGELLPCQL